MDGLESALRDIAEESGDIETAGRKCIEHILLLNLDGPEYGLAVRMMADILESYPELAG